MEQHQQSFQEALLVLLKQAKASEKVISKFMKDTQTLKVPFAQIVRAVRSQEEKQWIARKLN
jgi:hypothetical protein